MQRDILPDMQRMRHASDVFVLRDVTVGFIFGFGFDACYFLTPLARDPRSGRVLTNVGFSATWERAYRRALHAVDPLPLMAMDSGSPFWWADMADFAQVDVTGRRYLQIIRRFGMADGLVVPTYGPGLRCGLVGCGNLAGNRRLDDADIACLQMGIQASYLRYCDLISAEVEARPPLSNREMDVLYWVTKGKSNSVIADILGISGPTVDTYLRRVFAKLDVVDRTAAAVAAVQRGFFATGYYREKSQMPPIDGATHRVDHSRVLQAP